MTKLHITNANDGPELYIKPVPGQIVATVEPGPDQRFYAALFASAPALLKAARTLCAYMDQGGITAGQSDLDVACKLRALGETVERIDRLSKRVFKIPVIWTTEAYVEIVAADVEEAIDLAYDIGPDDCEEPDFRPGSFTVDDWQARAIAESDSGESG